VEPNNYIICYTGGTCGDLITALIDSTDAEIVNGAVKHSSDRSKLKKPHLFDSDDLKNSYLDCIFNSYASIPSHDIEYHVRQKQKFISIIIEQSTTALWAAKRFQSLHRPAVWIEMSKYCGANTVDDYAQTMLHYSSMVKDLTNYTLSLESILSGQAIYKLEQMTGITVPEKNKIFYKTWLKFNERM
jgi:hypothetical protein